MVENSSKQVFSASDAVELAVLDRCGFIESRHLGSAIVLGPGNTTLIDLGATGAPVVPRSCLKPLQAVAMAELGLSLSPVERVLSTASHAGTPAHVDVVRGMLENAGLTVDDLGCPRDWPEDRASNQARSETGLGPAPEFMNCSGKHAAMLATCVQHDWDTSNYLDPTHPLQQAILASIEKAIGEPVAATLIDGCGAPVFAVSLRGLAQGIAGIAGAKDGAGHELTSAILANGWAIDGPERDNTVVIDELGVVAKLGAEGVMVMGTRDGFVVALKMLDGSLRAATIVALELLVAVGALSSEQVAAITPRLRLNITGGNAVVGTIQSSALVREVIAARG